MRIDNTADNADITQSHARDTKHRRMQEVKGLCTDSRALRAEYCIVDISHNTAIQFWTAQFHWFCASGNQYSAFV